MDGLKYGIPGHTPLEDLKYVNPNPFASAKERFCRIKAWSGQEPLIGKEVIFATILNTNNKQ
jgi:hypothetical protein